LGHVYPWVSRKAICTGSEYVAPVTYEALPIQRRTFGCHLYSGW